MLASEILEQLDEADALAVFPDFATWYPVDCRLSAYRLETDWAILIESLVFCQTRCGHSCCTTMTYCYGNTISTPPCQDSGLQVTGDGPGGPLFDSRRVLCQC